MACRVCLQTGGKLYQLCDQQLAETFTDFTGIPITAADSLRQHICVFCRHLLLKSLSFRILCCDVQLMLQDVCCKGHQISTAHIDTLSKSLKLSMTKVQTISCIDTVDLVTSDDDIKVDQFTEDDLIRQLHENGDDDDNQNLNDGCIDTGDLVTADDDIKVEQFTEDDLILQLHENGDDDDDNQSLNDGCIDTGDLVTADDDIKVEECTEDDLIRQLHENGDDDDNQNLNDDINDEIGDDDRNDMFDNGESIINEGPLNSEDIIEIDRKYTENCLKSIRRRTEIENHKTEIEFTNKYMNNDSKSMLYNCISEKYTNRDNVRKGNALVANSLFICIDQGQIRENELNNDKSKDLEHLNMNKQKFEDFMKQKCSNNIEKEKKQTSTKKMKRNTKVDSKEKKKKKHKSKAQEEEELLNFSKRYSVEIRKLNKDEQMQDLLRGKETENYQKSAFKCEECYRGFTSEKTYQNHMVIHNPAYGAFSCDICHHRFTLRRRLHMHVKFHEFTFTCLDCRHVTRSSTKAKHHYQCHSGVKYTCEHCGKIFDKYASRINHVRIFHGSVRCEVCNEGFITEAGLHLHITKAHRELFKCSTCGVQFHNGLALQKHTESTNGSCGAHIRPCTQCGENLLTYDALKEHMHKYHNKKSRANPYKKQTKTGTKRSNVKKLPRCTSASNLTNSNTNTDTSIGTNSNTENTDNTNEELKNEELDQEDMKNKNMEMAYVRKKKTEFNMLMCEMCGRDGFKCAAVLRYHQRMHTGEKPIQCPQCPKRFRIRHTLQQHIAHIHSNERPYQCAICDKAFKSCPALSNHKRVHLKVRRHCCHLCDRAFHVLANLRGHIRRVHMKTPKTLQGSKTAI